MGNGGSPSRSGVAPPLAVLRCGPGLASLALRADFGLGGGMLLFRLTAGAAICGLLACGTSRSGPADNGGGLEGTPGNPAADHCVQARIDALTGVDEIVARHATLCSVDGDCLILDTSLSCQDSCGGAILASHATAFAKDLDQYATSLCPTLPVNCGLAPSCALVTGARCMDGTCRPVVAGMGQ